MLFLALNSAFLLFALKKGANFHILLPLFDFPEKTCIHRKERLGCIGLQSLVWSQMAWVQIFNSPLVSVNLGE